MRPRFSTCGMLPARDRKRSIRLMLSIRFAILQLRRLILRFLRLLGESLSLICVGKSGLDFIIIPTPLLLFKECCDSVIVLLESRIGNPEVVVNPRGLRIEAGSSFIFFDGGFIVLFGGQS